MSLPTIAWGITTPDVYANGTRIGRYERHQGAWRFEPGPEAGPQVRAVAECTWDSRAELGTILATAVVDDLRSG